ncbi:MAG: hypothetical protein RM021_028565 [Nostoc sp. EkiNYC01]|nr:hypothetical protein [Nostoc sp. EkiNYC01]
MRQAILNANANPGADIITFAVALRFTWSDRNIWVLEHSHKDAINRRLYKRIILVETAIYRVSCLNEP